LTFQDLTNWELLATKDVATMYNYIRLYAPALHVPVTHPQTDCTKHCLTSNQASNAIKPLGHNGDPQWAAGNLPTNTELTSLMTVGGSHIKDRNILQLLLLHSAMTIQTLRPWYSSW
jgi:hypothetical protein